MVNLLIVEDSPVFAYALTNVLKARKDLNIVKVFDTAERALQELDDLEVDLALVDLLLPGMNGIEFIEKAQKINAKVKHIIVSGNLSLFDVRRALDAGARGFVSKDHASQIWKAIPWVLDGKIYICSDYRAIL